MIALYGGTFDPIHEGHLAAARAAIRLLCVPSVRLVVAAQPYHKREGERVTPDSARYEMVRLACAGEPGLIADDSELGRTRPSFTVELLERRASDQPDERRVWLIGTDAFAEVLTWHRVADVFARTGFLVFRRAGHVWQPSSALSTFLRGRETTAFGDDPHGRVCFVNEPLPAVSSTQVRARVARGESIAGLVPAQVSTYIREQHLYETTGSE
ncbi:MAG: nicotinate (nicotinamide) nucleotide adenylyltransferase [Pseudomonadales bacterium]|nr:nicotinate (nicotinamide) nucleotide adenylyltransferase [Pseudomonadales bacterium]